MKKILILLLCLLLTASITGCGTQSIKPIDTIEGNMKTYSEMSDGTWQWMDISTNTGWKSVDD